jgi:hypothetical protein
MYPFVYPFGPDSGWYEKYWLTEQPTYRRKSYVGSLMRYVVVVALLVGGGVALSHFSG